MAGLASSILVCGTRAYVAVFSARRRADFARAVAELGSRLQRREKDGREATFPSPKKEMNKKKKTADDR